MNSVDHSELLHSWLDLSKSDYAKVIFCDLYHSLDEGAVGCRFQITDNVHEDPCDYVGLYRVGYESLEQCIASKMLCETECEEDGKQLRCIFEHDELPDIDDGFYQFLYITRDNEVCGASMPFEIKKISAEEASSDEDVVAEKGDEDDSDFLVVRSNLLAEKNRSLRAAVSEYRSQNEILEAELKKVKEEQEKALKEKEDIIVNLNQEVISLNRQLSNVSAKTDVTNGTILKLTKQLDHEAKLKNRLQAAKNKLCDDKEQLQKIIKDKESALALEINVLGQDKSLLMEQLEDSRTMIRALEDSKLLALREMNELTKVLGERNKILGELRRENNDLKCRLDDEIAVNIKQKKLFTELKCEHLAVVMKLEDTVSDNLAHTKEISNLKESIEELKKEVNLKKEELNEKMKREERQKAEMPLERECSSVETEIAEVQTSESFMTGANTTDVDKDTKIAIQERIIEELKLHISSLMFKADIEQLGLDDCVNKNRKDFKRTPAPHCPEHAKLLAENSSYELEIEVLKNVMEDKAKQADKVANKYCDLQSNCAQLDDMVNDFKTDCADLRSDVAIGNKIISKLQESVLKKDAVIEYLTKEKGEILKSHKTCDSCEEVKSRLKTAAELYKKQFLEIKKLKKKLLKKSSSVSTHSQGSSTLTDNFLEALIQQDLLSQLDADSEASTSTGAPVRNSDSDTGEHVLGNLNPSSKPSTSAEEVFQNCAARNVPMYPLIPTLLHPLIEQAPAAAEAGEPQPADAYEYLPCSLCDQVFISRGDHMKHLEEHGQRMCPVCGKLFDLSLPINYLIYHVEEHFPEK